MSHLLTALSSQYQTNSCSGRMRDEWRGREGERGEERREEGEGRDVARTKDEEKFDGKG